MALKNLDYFPKSFLSALKQTDYSRWQRNNAAKKTASFKVSLPPVTLTTAKKEDTKPSPPKHIEKPSGKKSSSKNMFSRRQKTGQQTALGSEIRMTRSMANVRVLQRLSKAKKNSLEELKRHSHFLLERNWRLVEDIKDKDADTARCVRDLLQQYDMFGMIITTLQDSSQNQVGVAKAELEETEKMVEKNMGKLEQELSRMNAKVRTLQDELNILRTYMDKEYPVKSVQIAYLLRSIQHLSEEQQDELEDAEEMARQLLKKIAKKTQEETEGILQAVVAEKVSEYQDGLQQMARNNQVLRQQIQMQKKIIDDLGKEIDALQKSTTVLREYVQHPRHIIFEDVLLRRPICTPDMEIVLNIPTEEDLPL